jgi:sortase A
MNQRTATIIGGTGRFLIGLGVVVIMFAVFQLYGTGLLEAQAQEELGTEFDDRLAALEDAGLVVAAQEPTADDPPPPEPTNVDIINQAIAEAFAPKLGERDGPEFTVAVIDPEALSDEEIALLTPRRGDVLGSIEIPDIGLERNIVEGIRRSDLRKGPGHYPTTPLPGQPGNAAIAGHRTTYGEPFHDLHLLMPGDLIKVTTFQGEHFYQVMPQTNDDGEAVGHFIVNPSQTEVLDDFGDNRLTLTACHPIRSSRQRIVVTAQLVSAPTEVLPVLTDDRLAELAGEEIDDTPVEESTVEEDETVGVEENALEESLGWNWEERTPTIAWGAGALAVVVAALVAARRWKKRFVYLGATPIFFFMLFFCFVHLDRMLPAL